MAMLLLSATDVIFQMGEEPAEPKMYIVASGMEGADQPGWGRSIEGFMLMT